MRLRAKSSQCLLGAGAPLNGACGVMQADEVLLHGAEDANGRPPWVMPNSLRNTEPGINVLIDRDADAPPEPSWDFSDKDDDAVSPVLGGSTSDAADDEAGGEDDQADDADMTDPTYAGDDL